MYPTTAAPKSARAAYWISRLPIEAWSPGLGRRVRISERQRDLIAAVGKRHAWRIRELAEQSGYTDPAHTARALKQLDTLGLIAHSSTRGRKGSTVAWIRHGAQIARPLATLMQSALALAKANVPTRETVRKLSTYRSPYAFSMDGTFPPTRSSGGLSSLAVSLARALQ